MNDMGSVTVNEDDVKFVRDRLFETTAFKFLPTPVILAGGDLGIYYINTEHLLEDGGKWKEFWTKKVKDAPGMIEHAIVCAQTNPDFGRVIDILANQVKGYIPEDADEVMLAGGQRRDWIFAGPIAEQLDLPIVILYKPGEGEVHGHADIMQPDGEVEKDVQDLSGLTVPHFGDLLTSGSSTYQGKDDPPTGWVPALRYGGATCNDSLVVVNRNQRGKDGLNAMERLAVGDIAGHAVITVDEDFFRQAYTEERLDGEQQAIAIAYQNDPAGWCNAFIRDLGITPTIVSCFDPDGTGLKRAGNFLREYNEVLVESGRRDELDNAVQGEFGRSLDEILPDHV